MELKNNSATHVSNTERHDAREKAKDRVAGLLDGVEFEMRQAMQMRLIQYAGCERRAAEWIAEYGARFAQLWERGHDQEADLINRLYGHEHRLIRYLAVKAGLSDLEWKKKYLREFLPMYARGEWEEMGEEAFKFILYNK
jgi:hypothetical protein